MFDEAISSSKHEHPSFWIPNPPKIRRSSTNLIKNVPPELQLMFFQDYIYAHPPKILRNGDISHEIITLPTSNYGRSLEPDWHTFFYAVPLPVHEDYVPWRIAFQERWEKPEFLRCHDSVCDEKSRKRLRFEVRAHAPEQQKAHLESMLEKLENGVRVDCMCELCQKWHQKVTVGWWPFLRHYGMSVRNLKVVVVGVKEEEKKKEEKMAGLVVRMVNWIFTRIIGFIMLATWWGSALSCTMALGWFLILIWPWCAVVFVLLNRIFHAVFRRQ